MNKSAFPGSVMEIDGVDPDCNQQSGASEQVQFTGVKAGYAFSLSGTKWPTC